MTEAGWISIVTLIMTGIGTMFASWVLLRQKQLDKKVQETKEQLDGRLTELLSETRSRYRAEGKAEAEAESKETAKALVEKTARDLEKLVRDKAEADALVLRTADAKMQLEKLTAALVDTEAEKALRVAKREADAAAARTPQAVPAAAPAPPLEMQGLTLTGTVKGTVEGDVQEKGSPAKKADEEKPQS